VIPPDLTDRIRELLEDDPSMPWDEALSQIVANDQPGAS
jgi:hypothetical protein